MKIYLAGPMRGRYEFNFPAFIDKAAFLRAEGHEVFSPAERDLAKGFQPWGMKGSQEELDELGFDLRNAIADDLDYICRHADAIYLLPGWTTSSGSKLELAAAKFCGLEVMGAES
jgi:hypothetical protein